MDCHHTPAGIYFMSTGGTSNALVCPSQALQDYPTNLCFITAVC